MMRAVLPNEYPTDTSIAERMQVSRSSLTRARQDIAPVWEATCDVIAEVVGAQDLDYSEASTWSRTATTQHDRGPLALVGLRQGLQLTTLAGIRMGSGEVEWARGTRGGTSGIAVVCVERYGRLLIAGAIR